MCAIILYRSQHIDGMTYSWKGKQVWRRTGHTSEDSVLYAPVQSRPKEGRRRTPSLHHLRDIALYLLWPTGIAQSHITSSIPRIIFDTVQKRSRNNNISHSDVAMM